MYSPLHYSTRPASGESDTVSPQAGWEDEAGAPPPPLATPAPPLPAPPLLVAPTLPAPPPSL